MGLHRENVYSTEEESLKDGFSMEEYQYNQAKYTQLSVLLKQQCQHLDYEICDSGVLNFNGSDGSKYSSIFWKFHEIHYPDGTKSFGSIDNDTLFRAKYRNGPGPCQEVAVCMTPQEVVNFMLKKFNMSNL